MQSIINKTTDKKRILKIIADNMLKTRPYSEVEYRPCIKQKEVMNQILYFSKINLFECYPDATKGDVAYAVTVLKVPHDEEILLCVSGRVKVIFDGKEIYTGQSFDKSENLPVRVRKGDNEVIFKCECDGEHFGFDFVPSTIHYPGMWAKDYLFFVNNTLPQKEFEGEEGFAVSKLYKSDGIDTFLEFEKANREYAFPKATEHKNTVDFNKLYDAENGSVAWALSYCKEDCETAVTSNVKVYVNKSQCDNRSIKLNKGDELLVMCEKKGDEWGFYFEETERLHIPFLKSSRKNGCEWLLLGSFANADIPDIQFTHIYIDKNEKECFWRFSDGISYLRPYLDSYFYGQWFYAIMVGEYGLLKTSELLGERYGTYFKDSMLTMAKYFDYMRYDSRLFGSPSFLQRSIHLDDLDSIGTMGMNFAELYMRKKDNDVLKVLEILTKAVKDNIPRFDDGTYHRTKTMWTDDTFMSCPFLVRMSKITGDDYYYNECINQIKGFRKRLYDENDKIFSHIYFIDDDKASGVPWGRGNGWVFFTLSELLLILPDSEEKKEILSLFCEFADGIRSLQDEDGMWHQVLNQPSTYTETSCTAMFILGMVRGIRNGWLDASYNRTIEKAWSGILDTSIDEDGNVYGVCKGSGCSYDWEYYAQLGTVVNDDHGTGVILAALCESIMLESELN